MTKRNDLAATRWVIFRELQRHGYQKPLKDLETLLCMCDRIFRNLLAQVVPAVWCSQLISDKLKSPVRARAIDLEASLDSSKYFFFNLILLNWRAVVDYHCDIYIICSPLESYPEALNCANAYCELHTFYPFYPLHTVLCLPVFCPVYPSRRAHNDPTGLSDHRTHSIKFHLSRWYQISATWMKLPACLVCSSLCLH